MPPKLKIKDEWKNITTVHGAVVTCNDACAVELVLKLNGDRNGEMIYAPLQDNRFFVQNSRVAEFRDRIDVYLNPLERKRTRAQRDDDDELADPVSD